MLSLFVEKIYIGMYRTIPKKEILTLIDAVSSR
jgi:hypothetical protein